MDKIERSPEFAETSRNQLLDLIRQNINHPSIFAWSLFNEIGPGSPDPHRELQDLKIVANGEDPTRPTIAATCTDKLPQMNKIPDLLGWNIYPGWYSEWGPKDEFRQAAGPIPRHQPARRILRERIRRRRQRRHNTSRTRSSPRPAASGIPRNGRPSSTKPPGRQ